MHKVLFTLRLVIIVIKSNVIIIKRRIQIIFIILYFFFYFFIYCGNYYNTKLIWDYWTQTKKWRDLMLTRKLSLTALPLVFTRNVKIVRSRPRARAHSSVRSLKIKKSLGWLAAGYKEEYKRVVLPTKDHLCKWTVVYLKLKIIRDLWKSGNAIRTIT